MRNGWKINSEHEIVISDHFRKETSITVEQIYYRSKHDLSSVLLILHGRYDIVEASATMAHVFQGDPTIQRMTELEPTNWCRNNSVQFRGNTIPEYFTQGQNVQGGYTAP